MDYIIFGIGSSATLVLAGWLLREWGPRLRDRGPAEDEVLSASALVSRMAWARFCATCGMAILICGVLIMLATLGAAFIAPTDRAATLAVISVFGLAVLLMLIWTGLYLRQFGALGIIRPREKPVPVEAQAPEVAATPASEPNGRERKIVRPQPSFAETTASRGGLGRFAAFFRRDADDTPEPASPVTNAVPAVVPLSNDGTQADIETSPTEAVIDELAGGSDASDDKKLSPSDPLVTSVREYLPKFSIEDAVVSEVLGPDHGDATAMDGERGAADGSPDATADNSGSPEPDHELALSQLRRRRLSRLSNPADQD